MNNKSRMLRPSSLREIRRTDYCTRFFARRHDSASSNVTRLGKRHADWDNLHVVLSTAERDGGRPPFHGHVTYAMEGEGESIGVRWRDRRNEYGATLIIVEALGAMCK